MKTVSRFRKSVLVAMALAGLLSACDSSAATQTTSSTSPPSLPCAADAPTVVRTQGWLQIFGGTAPAGAVHVVQLAVTDDPVVGQYVSDGSGRSLYRFDKDTATPPTCTCVGQ